MEYTRNFDIPLLHIHQSGKEYTINEALVRMDAIAAGIVKSRNNALPSSGAKSGDMYIVSSNDNTHKSKAGNIVLYINGRWNHITARKGLSFWVEDENKRVMYDGVKWS